jgi:Fe2+ transport system protein FeoA
MTRSLVTCRAGDRVVVGAVEGSSSRIDKLAAVGILPGVELRVVQTRPVVVVESDETVLALEREIAGAIVVSAVTGSAGKPVSGSPTQVAGQSNTGLD